MNFQVTDLSCEPEDTETLAAGGSTSSDASCTYNWLLLHLLLPGGFFSLEACATLGSC